MSPRDSCRVGSGRFLSEITQTHLQMDAFRKQASKFREQVAKQQQAVFKQFASHSTGDGVITDEAELQRHQQLERLYTSTRAGKHYQRDIIRGVEGLIQSGLKQFEVAAKLADDCRKYATESPGVGGALGRASLHFSNAWMQVEKDRDVLHRSLGTQVAEPLKAMVMGAPLEDARHLTQRYDRLRQEAEAQAADVGRRQMKLKEGGGNPEEARKLQLSEAKMTELASAMAVLGKEAAAAMTAVEAQQQRLTLQRLIAMVEAERTFHQNVAEVLDQLQAQMVSERQRSESIPPSITGTPVVEVAPPAYEDLKSNGQAQVDHSQSIPEQTSAQKALYFLAEVMHAFDGESEGELSLSVGDYVVVRQVSGTGWSEGECKGRAGWFPSTYVERRQKAPASKIAGANSL